MNDPIDLLQIRIEKAKRELPVETQNAIAAVDWRAAIFGLRTKYGYTFEQLGYLELETELLLCGLASPEDYPKELQNQLGISKMAANELANTMNDLVFKKIREELVKNTERKKKFAAQEKESKNKEDSDYKALTLAGIEILKEKPETTIVGKFLTNEETVQQGQVPENREGLLEKIENPEPFNISSGNTKTVHPILTQKFTGYVKNQVVETEHSLDNISKKESISPVLPDESSKTTYDDPYRVKPE